MPAPEKTTWHGRLRAFQLDSLCTVTESRTVVTVVVTAGLGASPIDGGDRCRSRLGFRYGKEIEQRRKKVGLGFVQALYGSRASLVTTSGKERATASEEEEHASVLASMRVERMRTTSSGSFLTKGYTGSCWAGVWAASMGCCWAPAAR
jgi:hypothetical protein